GWWLERLHESYPALAAAYARAYRGVYAPSRYVAALERRVARLAAEHGIVPERRSSRRQSSSPEQLRLALAGACAASAAGAGKKAPAAGAAGALDALSAGVAASDSSAGARGSPGRAAPPRRP